MLGQLISPPYSPFFPPLRVFPGSTFFRSSRILHCRPNYWVQYKDSGRLILFACLFPFPPQKSVGSPHSLNARKDCIFGYLYFFCDNLSPHQRALSPLPPCAEDTPPRFHRASFLCRFRTLNFSNSPCSTV